MKQKTILFDVDGVLADFTNAFRRTAGLDPLPPPGALTWEDYSIGLDDEQKGKVWQKVMTTPWWWAGLQPLCSTEDARALQALANNLNNQLVFATNREGTPNAQVQTREWIRTFFSIMAPSVVLTKRKGEMARAIDADYAIDDKPENCACLHWISDVQPTKVYILDNAMNHDVSFLPKKVRRVFSVAEFIEDINNRK